MGEIGKEHSASARVGNREEYTRGHGEHEALVCCKLLVELAGLPLNADKNDPLRL